MKKPKEAAPALKLLWRDHDSNGRIKRVWQSTWASDQFEILSPDEFDALEKFCQRLSITLEEAEDD